MYRIVVSSLIVVVFLTAGCFSSNAKRSNLLKNSSPVYAELMTLVNTSTNTIGAYQPYLQRYGFSQSPSQKFYIFQKDIFYEDSPSPDDALVLFFDGQNRLLAIFSMASQLSVTNKFVEASNQLSYGQLVFLFRGQINREIEGYIKRWQLEMSKSS